MRQYLKQDWCGNTQAATARAPSLPIHRGEEVLLNISRLSQAESKRAQETLLEKSGWKGGSPGSYSVDSNKAEHSLSFAQIVTP